MYRCLLLCYSGVAPSSLLLKFIERTGCLELSWVGTYAELAPSAPPAAGWDLVFATLPAPDHPLLDSYWRVLQGQKALILSSLYPEKMFVREGWRPVAFLNEPFSFEQFQEALQRYLDQRP
ncbi:hypothetical protein SAMN02745146_3015 [Hymenobacter daecheongensis DSM 21074]|uniref:Response regulatory domain-containing protein n=1 Tax=Hymenobacter daecheongensis DSM 21074 TaxID=1121955 RepID=A0A1M6IY27_9BACT|nr:hypothetical protein [Hymenobacter daecheongensis]SHJ39335.1 hypothetical protein SAMN02745146_3015 [Hymenobacter daecheongensis DSM 21074]